MYILYICSSWTLPARANAGRDLAPCRETQRGVVPVHQRPIHRSLLCRHRWQLFCQQLGANVAQSRRRFARYGFAVCAHKRYTPHDRMADWIPRARACAAQERGVEGQRHGRVARCDIQGSSYPYPSIFSVVLIHRYCIPYPRLFRHLWTREILS